MTKYEVRKEKENLAIDIKELGMNHSKVLTKLQECQNGSCSCPTQEYEKLEDMQISQESDAISIKISPKSGETFNADEVKKCIDYSIDHK